MYGGIKAITIPGSFKIPNFTFLIITKRNSTSDAK